MGEVWSIVSAWVCLFRVGEFVRKLKIRELGWYRNSAQIYPSIRHFELLGEVDFPATA